MSQKLSQIPQLLLSELSDREQMLWQLLREREEFIAELKDEIARLKGEKAQPKIQPSRLEPSGKSKSEPEAENNDSTEALSYMEPQKLPQNQRQKLNLCQNRVFKNQEEWETSLNQLGIVKSSHVKKATEGALLGAIISNGVSSNLGIISDGAGQFRLLEHGLCWVHAERLINKLIPLTEEHLKAVEGVQDQIWQFYQDLKVSKNGTEQQLELQKTRLENRFEEIFSQSTCFEPLDQVLARRKRRKAELLKVLEKPELPLHNNASEQDIREFVKKRKISGSTRSEEGRRCRDTFASLKKTCRKLGVSFGNYLIDRVCNHNKIPALAQLIAEKAGSLCPLAQENLVSVS